MDRLEQRNEGERYARKKRYEKTGSGKGAEVQISDIERKVLTVIGPTATKGIGGGIDSSERRSLTHSTPVMSSFEIQPSTTCDTEFSFQELLSSLQPAVSPRDIYSFPT